MRVDLTQEGDKDIDVELNGKKIENVLWADDGTGECEVFETDWRSGELVKAPDTTWGYRTVLLKGKVKINDRRPKTPVGDTVYDFQYPGMCSLRIAFPSIGAPDVVMVFSVPDQDLIQTFPIDSTCLTDIEEVSLALVDRLSVAYVNIMKCGRGRLLHERLTKALHCPVHLV